MKPDLQTETQSRGCVQRSVRRRFVSWNTRSESPQDFCEQCHDTGFAGDNGPGGCGSWNYEYAACDCDPVARLRRQRAREAEVAERSVSKQT